MDKPTTPSEQIEGLLSGRDLTQAWLARQTRIPPSTLDRKLRGDGRDLTLAQLNSIAQALSVSVVELLPGTSVEAVTA